MPRTFIAFEDHDNFVEKPTNAFNYKNKIS